MKYLFMQGVLCINLLLHFTLSATLLISMSETQLNKLQVAQNRAMKVVLQSNRKTKVEYMMKAQFMNIRQRPVLQCVHIYF